MPVGDSRGRCRPHCSAQDAALFGQRALALGDAASRRCSAPPRARSAASRAASDGGRRRVAAAGAVAAVRPATDAAGAGVSGTMPAGPAACAGDRVRRPAQHAGRLELVDRLVASAPRSIVASLLAVAEEQDRVGRSTLIMRGTPPLRWWTRSVTVARETRAARRSRRARAGG